MGIENYSRTGSGAQVPPESLGIESASAPPLRVVAGEPSHELSHLILLLGEVWRLLGVDVAEHLGERRLGRGLGGVERGHHVAPGGRARGLFAGVVPPALGGERLGAGVRTTLYHTHTHEHTHTQGRPHLLEALHGVARGPPVADLVSGAVAARVVRCGVVARAVRHALDDHRHGVLECVCVRVCACVRTRTRVSRCSARWRTPKVARAGTHTRTHTYGVFANAPSARPPLRARRPRARRARRCRRRAAPAGRTPPRAQRCRRHGTARRRAC